MKLAIIYFSATNNTKVIAEIIRKEFESLGASVDMHDVTSLADRQQAHDFSLYDAFVFGFPIHSLRAPRVIRDWLRTIQGEGRKCGMFFTYGGFMIHPAHHSTREILNEQNFVVVSSAEFPGAHTFNIGGWRAFPDRPDAREFELSAKYAEETYKRFSGEHDGMLGELDKGLFSDEQLDQFESLRFKIITRLPSRDGAECSLCGRCEEVCPTGAMNFETGNADPTKCIACLGCVAACTDNVLNINSTLETWQLKLDMGNTNEADLNKQTGKMYL